MDEVEKLLNKRYHSQYVEIVIDKDSKLYRKIQRKAIRDEVNIENVVDMLLTLASDELLEQQLDRMEKVRRK